MSESLNLYRLQQLDTRLNQVEVRQKAIQDSLENNIPLNDAKNSLNLSLIEKKNLENVLRNMELDAQQKKTKIGQIESDLYSGGIKSPKELQELQQELTLIKRQLTTLEDQELDEMISLEKIQAELDSRQEVYEKTRKQAELQNSGLVNELDDLQKEADRLRIERNATVQSIEEKSLSLYNRIREERHGIAVTTISDNSCDSCGAVLTHSQQQSAHHSHQLFRCLSCGRIIYS
jgi:predicted  nucleic acid-binding Zn-ribbon protein